MNTLSKKFDAAVFNIYKRAKSEANYNATIFLSMLNDRGGLSTAKYLINASKPSDGSYCQIWCLRVVGHAAIWLGFVASIPSLNVTPVMTLAR